MKLMNKQLLVIAALFLAAMFTLQACDEGLTEMNVNPTTATELDAEFLFTRAQLEASEGRFEAWRGNLIYASSMIQHLSSTTTAWAGDRYTINNDYISAHWNLMYPNAVKHIEDVVAATADDPDMVTMHSQARIFRVFIYHRLTDLYGDIPYSEAGKGFLENNTSPVYDPQEEIYKDMLNELSEAIDAMDPNAVFNFGSNDLLYQGDVAQWRKFGNSLKLRLGMRLTEVDPALAQSTVEAAAVEVMDNVHDSAWINHASGPSGINRNGVGEVFQDFGLTGHNFRLSNTLVDVMKDEANENANVDPRLPVFGKIYNDDGDVVSTDPMDFVGLQNGLDAPALGNLELIEFPIPNRETVGSYSAPNLLLTYAETRFTLAEAAYRGWNVPGSAQEHYEAGIRGAMQHLAWYGSEGEISQDAIETYVSNVAPADMEQINIQKWIALYMNGYEAYANWRRTGIPDLTPVNFPGNETGGQIPRRYLYPIPEQQNNRANYEAAIDRQGPDDFMTRMWWDAP